MKYSIITFGCRVNQADSLGFEEQLRAVGAQPVAADQADIVVVNTCSVTASSDQGARQTIRRIARVNPDARVIVTGCYATRDRAQVERLPNVTHVIRNDDKPALMTFVRAAASHAAHNGGDAALATQLSEGAKGCAAALEPGVAGRTAFTLRVQTGCAEACSYCIIPETRGAPRSVAPPDVVAEVRRVHAAGFREVALTGVHLGSYGRDLTPRSSLLTLLLALRNAFEAAEPRIVFRISSLEPMDCTDDIVSLVSESACFAPHFHLPMQHASDRLLDLMRRPYHLEQYARLVDGIRRLIPHASIGSDVIVGFPGESDQDFDALTAYLPVSPLTHVHVFPYSDRPGTVASTLGNRAPGVTIKERGAVIRQIGGELTRAFVRSQLGTTHRALTLEDGTLAVTGNYLKARIPAGHRRNQWVRVHLVATEPVLRGECV